MLSKLLHPFAQAHDAHAASLPVTRRPIAHARLYTWYIVLATLDLLTTIVILNLGGREANPLANSVLQAAGPPGLLVLKYASVMLVVTICEYVHERRPPLARQVAIVAVALSAFPVIVGAAQLAAYNARVLS